ncbi:hypothetical protein B9Z41_01575 [Limnohabitans sp. JirII-31]|nr:hypothetical protein B9Z41_01575 [Limnohabitans sp. JirII-31]
MTMSQQINLLTRRRTRKSLAWYSIRGVALLVLALTSVAIWNEFTLREQLALEKQTQKSIAAAKAVLDQKRRASGLEDADALAKASSAMRSRLDARRELVGLIDKGELGSLSGHSGAMSVLATISENEVWVRQFEVTKAGKSMVIVGNALSNEAVMRYANRLNEAFKAFGYQFSSMELSREEVSVGAAAAQKADLIKFKLY